MKLLRDLKHEAYVKAREKERNLRKEGKQNEVTEKTRKRLLGYFKTNAS